MSSSTSIIEKRSTRRKISTAIRYIILGIGAIIMLYPMIWLVGAAFKTNSEIFSSIGFIPNNLDFSPFTDGWKTATEYTFTTYFINSFKIVIPKVIFTVVSSVIVAYGFARFKFPGKKIFMGILISTLFLPNIVTRVPLYLLWRDLGMLDTYIPLVLPSLFGVEAFFVFMLVQFMRGIPRDLEEAANIDGCNSLQTLIKVIIPTMKPALISVALFQFMWTMNDFLGPLIYISSVSKYPVSIALKMAMDTTSGAFEWNSVIAMSIISLIPSLILFFLAQKQFIEGVTSSGIKG